MSVVSLRIHTLLMTIKLWMGTHPSNPSRDLTTSRTLLDLVQENQMLLSPSIAKKFGQKLPFLFKVLSINKALSIQAHPNKKLAEQLHAKDSKNYPDDNHKPEMAIAITPFEGLCGFRPLEQIKHFLKTVPSLRELVGDDQSQEFEEAVEGHGASEDGKKKALKHAFTSLMESKSDEIESTSKLLIKQAKEEGSKFAGGGGESNDGKELADLMVRLDGQFPNDIGLFVTFFLNYVKLEPGEAMFLKADDIHAYLSGGEYLHHLTSFSRDAIARACREPSHAHYHMHSYHELITSLTMFNSQTSSNAWPPATMSFVQASHQSSKTCQPSRQCSHTPSPRYQSRRWNQPTTPTASSTQPLSNPTQTAYSTTRQSQNSQCSEQN